LGLDKKQGKDWTHMCECAWEMKKERKKPRGKHEIGLLLFRNPLSPRDKSGNLAVGLG